MNPGPMGRKSPNEPKEILYTRPSVFPCNFRSNIIWCLPIAVRSHSTDTGLLFDFAKNLKLICRFALWFPRKHGSMWNLMAGLLQFDPGVLAENDHF
jgi:hypothetical protein